MEEVENGLEEIKRCFENIRNTVEELEEIL
jgi:hypothetical protein